MEALRLNCRHSIGYASMDFLSAPRARAGGSRNLGRPGVSLRDWPRCSSACGTPPVSPAAKHHAHRHARQNLAGRQCLAGGCTAIVDPLLNHAERLGFRRDAQNSGYLDEPPFDGGVVDTVIGACGLLLGWGLFMQLTSSVFIEILLN
jgi:hypothetical protein